MVFNLGFKQLFPRGNESTQIYVLPVEKADIEHSPASALKRAMYPSGSVNHNQSSYIQNCYKGLANVKHL